MWMTIWRNWTLDLNAVSFSGRNWIENWWNWMKRWRKGAGKPISLLLFKGTQTYLCVIPIHFQFIFSEDIRHLIDVIECHFHCWKKPTHVQIQITVEAEKTSEVYRDSKIHSLGAITVFTCRLIWSIRGVILCAYKVFWCIGKLICWTDRSMTFCKTAENDCKN